ncbi:MAG: DUF423 domain-containing protein [Pseudohongiellaceae bacterium]
MPHFVLAFAALNGFLAVSLGAFAAHGLRNTLSPDLLDTFQTGVQYHMYHALALFGVGLLMLHFPSQALLRYSALAFAIGLVLFSGSLYVLSLSGIRWLGAITPLGGIGFLAGWGLLVAAMLVSRNAT